MFRIVMNCLLECRNEGEAVTVPRGVQAIGPGAFARAYGMKKICIPSSVVEIREQAFSGCTDLQEIVLERGNRVFQMLGSGLYRRKDRTMLLFCAAEGTCTVPEEVLRLESGAFSSCPKLTRVILPGVQEIGEGCFRGCTALTEVVMPEVRSLGKEAFFGCISLKQVELPKAETIGEGCFRDCSGLRDIVMPEVRSLGYDAFENCRSLTELRIPKGVSEVSGLLVYGCEGLRHLVVEGSRTQVKTDRFFNGTGLKMLPIRFSALDPENVPKMLRKNALLDLSECIAGGEQIPRAVLEAWLPLIRAHRKEVWSWGGLFPIMLQEKMIPAEEYSWFLAQTEQSGDVAKKAALLEYRRRVIPDGELERAELRAVDRELRGLERDIRTGPRKPSQTEQLKKIWRTKKQPDGTLLLRGLKMVTEQLEVPAAIGKTAVSAMENSVGRDMEGIRSIHIPAGLRLGPSVFSRCEDLEEVTLDANVMLGMGAFCGCPQLRSFHLDPAETVRRAEGPILYETRNGHRTIRIASGLTGHAEIPEGVEVIQSLAFLWSRITGVTLPSSLREIQDSAFGSCWDLEKVTVPPGVEYVGYLAFGDCRSLRTVTIASADTRVSASAFDARRITLVAPPENRSVQEIVRAGRVEFRPLER